MIFTLLPALRMNVCATNVNLRQYKRIPPLPIFSSHAQILNLHSLSLCQLMFYVLCLEHLSPTVCTTRCSKAEKIELSHLCLLIHFNSAFYIGKLTSFLI